MGELELALEDARAAARRLTMASYEYAKAAGRSVWLMGDSAWGSQEVPRQFGILYEQGVAAISESVVMLAREVGGLASEVLRSVDDIEQTARDQAARFAGPGDGGW